MRSHHSRLYALLFLAALATACSSSDDDSDSGSSGSDGPGATTNPNIHATGNAAAGRDVFRFETFGNEGFWTDAMRLPQGIVAAGVTPLDALAAGLSVDAEALDQATLAAIAAELLTDLSPANAPLLNDPATTVLLVNANAVIGIAAKDSNGDGTIDVTAGDRAGATCALCHTITDGSVFALPCGGSIGRRLDGRAPHDFDFGGFVALAQNSRALYPLLQLSLTANGGETLGRAPTGLTENSTEAEVDAYLSNPQFYPVGMFDDTFDGNGDPMHNMPLFRTDLAAPWGSGGSLQFLDNFSNLVYTGLLDPTTLTTAGGRAFLETLAGPAGTEIADDYVVVLAATGVTNYPFITAGAHAFPGTEAAPLGVRVDNAKLLDLNAYLNSLEAPPGIDAAPEVLARGRERFRQSCTQCHNVAQGSFVPPGITPMLTIWPGDDPVVLAERDLPLNDILNSPGFFDDKMAVVNASLRGLERGIAMPLLLDLARKPILLHDNSIRSLNGLLNPVRGPEAPHPFYEPDAVVRAELVAFLESLDTDSN